MTLLPADSDAFAGAQFAEKLFERAERPRVAAAQFAFDHSQRRRAGNIGGLGENAVLLGVGKRRAENINIGDDVLDDSPWRYRDEPQAQADPPLDDPQFTGRGAIGQLQGLIDVRPRTAAEKLDLSERQRQVGAGWGEGESLPG